MTRWVSLLRGVNVGGVTIRSVDLAAVFRDLGFEAVTTFLASGNVRFESDAAPSARAALKRTIEQALRDRFGYDAWIVLLTESELAAAIEAFPFEAADSSRQPYVVFCSDGAVREEIMEAAASVDSSVDPIGSGPGVIYWNPVTGTTLQTPFAKVLSRSRYKATTTSRNLRTLVKIVA